MSSALSARWASQLRTTVLQEKILAGWFAVEDRMHTILKEAQNAATAIKHEFSILLMKLPKQARPGSMAVSG